MSSTADSVPDTSRPGAPVRVTREGGVLVVTLDRPAAKNAMTLEMARIIATAMDDLDQDPTLRVAVLTGNGDVFCAGMDLKRFLAGERPVVPGRGFAGLAEQPPRKPLVVAVNGPALAGGFELALAADLVVASTTARFGLPEVKRGLVAAGGGLVRLHDWLPRAVANEVLLTGEPISAEEAYRHGLVNRLVEPDRLIDTALELARAVAANGPLAVQATKEVVGRCADWPVAARIDRARAISEPVFRSEDAREGAAAFAERRQPRWSGR